MICKSCGQEKEDSCFYIAYIKKDGTPYRRRECSKCRYALMEDYRNSEKGAAILKISRRKWHEKFGLEKSRKWKAANKKKVLEYNRRHRLKTSKIKKIAWDRLHKAVKRGLVIRQACLVCGETNKTEAHHEDYTKPLEVVWLCRKHHSYVHYSIIQLCKEAKR